jgi:predicted Zn-dependent protease
VRPGLPALARASYLRELSGRHGRSGDRDAAGTGAGRKVGVRQAVVDTLLADLLYRQGDLDAAATQYDAALRGSPELVTAATGAPGRGRAGDVDAAVERLEQLNRARPTVVSLTLLWQLQSSGATRRRGATAACCARSRAAGGGRPGGRPGDGAVRGRRRRAAREAVRFARAAHAARPDNVFVNDALAWALLADGQAAAAVPHVEQALRLGTADPLLRYHAAEVFAAVGDLDRARAELQVVRRSTPWFSFAHLSAAGRLAERLGVEAAAAWTGSPRLALALRRGALPREVGRRGPGRASPTPPPPWRRGSSPAAPAPRPAGSARRCPARAATGPRAHRPPRSRATRCRGTSRRTPARPARRARARATAR